MKKSFKKVVAIVSAIAMVVTSLTVYNAKTVEASGSATVDGVIYTVTDGSNNTIAGFTCQGFYDNPTYERIHFAWGSVLTVDTIKATVNGTEVTVDGKNEHGMFIKRADVTGLGAGEYEIVVSGNDADGNTLYGYATLKMEEQGETESPTEKVVAGNPEDVD